MLTSIYSKLEDAFYTLLDTLDSMGVPVYRVHDFLDEHGIPPFPFFLVLVTLLIGGALYFFWPRTYYTLTVYVEDAYGNPLSGAEVVADGPSLFEGITDDTGGVSFYPLPPGEYTVTVYHPDYGSTGREVRVEDEYTDIVLTLEPKTRYASIRLRVISSDGVPLPAEVVVYSEERVYTPDYLGEGEFVLEKIPVGTYTVSVIMEGYEKAERTVTLEEGENPLVITLEPVGGILSFEGGNVKITVTENGEEVDALVELANVKTGYTESRYTPATFSIPPGDYTVTVKRDGEEYYFPVTAFENGEYIIDLSTEEIRRVSGVDAPEGSLVEVTTEDGNILTSVGEEGVITVPADNRVLDVRLESTQEVPEVIEYYTLTLSVPSEFSYRVKAKEGIFYEKGTGEGEVSLEVPGGEYYIEIKAGRNVIEREVLVNADTRVEISPEEIELLLTFILPFEGSVEVNGVEKSGRRVEFLLPPGEYTYTVMVEGYYPLEDSILLKRDRTVRIRKDMLISEEYVIGEPEAYMEVRDRLGELPVVTPKSTIVFRVRVPKAEEVVLRTNFPEEKERVFRNPRPVVEWRVRVKDVPPHPVDITLEVVVDGETYSYAWNVDTLPYTLEAWDGVRYALLVNGEKGSRFRVPPEGFEVEVYVYGAVARLGGLLDETVEEGEVFTLEAEKPSYISLLLEKEGKTMKKVYQILPSFEEYAPYPYIHDIRVMWRDRETGEVLLEGGRLEVDVRLPEGTRNVYLAVRTEGDPRYYPSLMGKNEATQRAKPSPLVTFIIPFSFPSTPVNREMDVSLQLVVEKRDNTVETVEERLTVFATSVDFKPLGDTPVYYALKVNGEWFPDSTEWGEIEVEVWGFVTSEDWRLVAGVDDREISLSSPYPTSRKVEVTSYEENLTILFQAVLAEDVVYTEELNIELTERLRLLTVCTWWNEVRIDSIVTVEGETFRGDEVSTVGKTENGCTYFELPEGRYTVTARVEDFFNASEEVVLNTDKRVDLKLVVEDDVPELVFDGPVVIEEGTTLTFRVYLPPVENATMYLYPEPFSPSPPFSLEKEEVPLESAENKVDVKVNKIDVPYFPRETVIRVRVEGKTVDGEEIYIERDIPLIITSRSFSCNSENLGLVNFTPSFLQAGEKTIKLAVVSCGSVIEGVVTVTNPATGEGKTFDLDLQRYEYKVIEVDMELKEGENEIRVEVKDEEEITRLLEPLTITVYGPETIIARVRVKEGV